MNHLLEETILFQFKLINTYFLFTATKIDDQTNKKKKKNQRKTLEKVDYYL